LELRARRPRLLTALRPLEGVVVEEEMVVGKKGMKEFRKEAFQDA
jgi:hypothetical protein